MPVHSKVLSSYPGVQYAVVHGHLRSQIPAVEGEQVHGGAVHVVRAAPQDRRVVIPGVDGLATNVPGVTLSVKSADCVPLLFYDPSHGAIGSAHTGWKGTIAGIAGNVVQAMHRELKSNPRDLLVWMGPSIGPCCYEVSRATDGRIAAFRKRFGSSSVHQHNGGMYLDLWEANRRILLKRGVRRAHVEVSGICTTHSSMKLPSYYRHHTRSGHLTKYEDRIRSTITLGARKTSLVGTRVAVVGLGVEGSSLAQFFLSRGAQVAIHHRKSLAELARGTPGERQSARLVRTLTKRHVPLTLHLGRSYLRGLEHAELVGVVQSAFKTAYKRQNAKLWQARASGVPIVTDLSLFLAETTSRVIGITGTNGKTTTTELAAAMMKHARRAFFYGGNIGRSPLTLLVKRREPPLVLLEMSNYQLEHLTKSPPLAVILNMQPDHLEDYGGSFARYMRAKERIVAFQGAQDQTVLNWDDVRVRKIGKQISSRAWWFSRTRVVSQGSFVRGGWIVFRQGPGSLLARVLPFADIRVPGAHNVENVLAAVTVAKLLGIPSQVIRRAVRAFRLGEHRIEFVRRHHGVAWYNDSKSTTPASTIAAVRALARGKNIILIAGGQDKGMPFDTLARTVRTHVKTLVLIGKDREKIRYAVGRVTRQVPVVIARTLQGAVAVALRAASSGDTVLLSPACASFDMFTSYEDRGNQFKAIVGAL